MPQATPLACSSIRFCFQRRASRLPGMTSSESSESQRSNAIIQPSREGLYSPCKTASTFRMFAGHSGLRVRSASVFTSVSGNWASAGSCFFGLEGKRADMVGRTLISILSCSSSPVRTYGNRLSTSYTGPSPSAKGGGAGCAGFRQLSNGFKLHR